MGLLGLITKDISEENADKRTIVALRILYIIVLLAFTIDMIIAGFGALKLYPVRIVMLFLSNIILLVSTYKTKTKPALILFILFLFTWTVLMIPVYGWSAGMQNYYIPILMLLFFATHSKPVYKFFYAGLVLVVRIMTIFIYGGVISEVCISDLDNKLIQITNISAVFFCIIFISYVFSKRENEAENKLMKYNDRLKKEANTDQLTGLFNRRKADEYLSDIVSENNGRHFSVAIGDIDFFKKVNDTYGHDIGDIVLKELARTIENTSRSDTFVARWGGEEFLIVFPDCNGDDAFIALERLRKTIQDTPIIISDITLNITMTFGLAELSFKRDAEATIKQADEKLYIGKHNGRNQVVY